MFKKITLVLLISLVMIGVVFAADLESFKAPSNFKDLGDGVYVLYKADNKNADEILSVVEYKEHDWKDYVTNDTTNNYTVYKGENNTFNYTDGSQNEKGSFELIEVGGVKYIIDFTKSGIDDANDFTATYTNLLNFNKLNNVTALEGEIA